MTTPAGKEVRPAPRTPAPSRRTSVPTETLQPSTTSRRTSVPVETLKPPPAKATPKPAPKPAPATKPYDPTAGLNATQADAFAYVNDLLNQYGLGSLTSWVRQEIINGRTNNEIILDMRSTPEFKAAFPEIQMREQAGLPPLSPADIVNYRAQATQMMKAAGLPPGFYDNPRDFTQLLAGDVSISELGDRIQMAKDATYNIPPETAARLHSEYGLAPGSGALAAYFIDPQKALPLLQQQFTAAQIGGRADQTGFAGVTNAQALALAQNGVSDSQAQSGFASLARQSQILNNLPGEQGQGVTTDQAIGAQFLGNAADQQLIDLRRQNRQAEFADNVGYATTARGTVGLAPAT